MNQSDQTPSSVPIEETAQPAVQEKPFQKENRVGKFLKSAIRWVFGLLIVFSLGALIVIFTLYSPTRQSLLQAQTDLTTANQKIADLENQVKKIATLESQNIALQKEVDASVLHINLLTALADVDSARVALAEKDSAAAKAALTNTTVTMKDVASLAGSSQSEAVKFIQDRLDLVLSEIETDTVTAQSDLVVMATKLLELEKALFSQ
jgi:cytoskeletal protein RodZ